MRTPCPSPQPHPRLQAAGCLNNLRLITSRQPDFTNQLNTKCSVYRQQSRALQFAARNLIAESFIGVTLLCLFSWVVSFLDFSNDR